MVGRTNRLLAGGVTQHWREVIVPLKIGVPLDRRQLAGLTLEFTNPGRCTVYIDDISFKTRRDATVPTTKRVAVGKQVMTRLPKSIWIWSTRPLLVNPDARQTLFQFCREQFIQNLWMQLNYSQESVALKPLNVSCHIKHQPQLRSFLRDAHRRGLTVHALDGLPEFSLKGRHHEPLAVVDAVIAWNAGSPAEERFDGVHFDNEPYLLVGWQSRRFRQQVLKEFLDLNVECEPGSSEPIASVEYRGQRKPASFHCIDLLDQVGIMNYRDTADGPDGMIAHGRDLLRYGDKVGRAKIVMGVETFASEPVHVWFAAGLPRETFANVLNGTAGELARRSRIDGFRMRTLDDGANIHVGIELPAKQHSDTQQRSRAAMLKIARRFGCSGLRQSDSQSSRIRDRAREHLRSNSEWSRFRHCDIDVGGNQPPLTGFEATSMMLPKITFADNSVSEFESQSTQAETVFARFSSYSGQAIHFYQTYRRMFEKPPSAPKPRSNGAVQR